MSPWYSKKCEIGESILASHLKMQIKKKNLFVLFISSIFLYSNIYI